MPSSHCPRSKAIQCQSLVCQGALTGITREALVPRSSPCTKQVLILLLRLQAQSREKAALGVSGKQPWNPRGPEQREQHWPQGCSAGKSQPSPAIASARLSLLKLLSRHPWSGHSRAPTCSHPTEGAPSHSCLQTMGLAPAHPSTKIKPKIFLRTSPRGLQGNRRVPFPGFQMFLQSSI